MTLGDDEVTDASEPASGDGLSSFVYRELRRSIVFGSFRPNAVISEVELAKELEVSRTPVRESLHRLATDGLVRRHRRRWVVHEHSLDEIRETYEVRSALEGQAAALAAVRATDAELAEMMRTLEETAPFEFSTGSSELVAVNGRFHDLVIRFAGNRTLQRAIESATLYYFNYELASLYSDTERMAAARQHRVIANAIRDRDPEEARAAAVAHVGEAWTILAEKLRMRAPVGGNLVRV